MLVMALLRSFTMIHLYFTSLSTGMTRVNFIQAKPEECKELVKVLVKATILTSHST